MAGENQSIYELVLKLDQYLRPMESLNRANASMQRSFSGMMRGITKGSIEVTDKIAKIATASAKATTNVGKYADKQIKSTTEVAKAMGKAVDAYSKEVLAQKKVEEQTERTAQAQIKASADIEKARVREIESNNLLKRTELQLQMVREQSFAATGKFTLGTINLANILNVGLNDTLKKTGEMFANTALSAISLSNAIGIVTKVVGVAIGVLALLARVVGKTLLAAFNAVIAPIKAVANQIISFFNRISAVAVGVMIRDVIFGIMRFTKDLITTVMQTVSAFQVLEIRFDTLAARQLRLAYSTMTVQESMVAATDVTKSLMTWITKLGTVVPFDLETIANTQAFAQAMGFSVGGAKDLTEAVLEYTAAMGLGSEVAERIIFNFGQMKAQGKVTSTEMRDLARGAFFPLTQVLDIAAKKLGISGENLKQFREEAAEGKIDIQTFFDAFKEFVASDFPGALERMGRTLQGSAVRLRNILKTVVGIDILGPLGAKLGESLAQIVDILSSPKIRQAAQLIGKALATAFAYVRPALDTLKQSLIGLAEALGINVSDGRAFASIFIFIGVAIRRAITAISNFVKSLAEKLDGGFGDTIKKAQAWGYNLVAMFAKGMASAIKLIVLVINTINQILSYWFSPGSPPKIAPDLDKWGAAAISEWFKGWTNFDVTVFSDIANTIESFMRSISSKIGGKDNINLIPLILGSRKVIADAINNVRAGLMTVADAASYVFKRIGNLTTEFRDFITAMFDVEAAQQRVADAAKAVAAEELKVAEATKKVTRIQGEIDVIQERQSVVQDQINATTEKYNDILDELRKKLEQVTDVYSEQQRLQQISEAIGTGLLTARERERLEMERQALITKQQIRDTETARDAEVGALEDRLDILEAEEAAANARLKAAQAERDAAQERVDIAKEAEDAAKAELDIAQARLDLAKAIIDEQIKQNELIQEQLALLESLKEAAGGAGGGDDIIGGAAEDWDNFGISIETALEKWRRAYDEFSDRKELGFPGNFSQMFRDAEKAFTDFSTSLGGLKEALSPLTGKDGALSGLFDALSGLLGLVSGGESPLERISRIKEDNVTPAERFGKAVERIAAAFADFPWEAFATAMSNMALAFADIDWEKVGENIGTVVEKTGEVGVAAAEGGPVWALSEAFTNLSLGILSSALSSAINIATLGGAIDIFGTDTETTLTTTKNSFIDWLDDTSEAIFKWARDNFGNSVYPDAMQDMQDTTTTKLDEIKAYWTTILDDISGYLDDPFAVSIQNIIDTVLTALKTFFDTTLPTAWETAKGKLKELKDYIEGEVSTALNNFKANVLQPLWEKFENIRSKIAEVVTWIGELITAIGELDIGKVLQLLGKAVGLQSGGFAAKGGRYIVGEAGREMFIPLTSGIVLPNWLTERVLASPASTSTVVNNFYNVEVNPSYSNMQSEASVYYDVTAALAATRR